MKKMFLFLVIFSGSIVAGFPQDSFITIKNDTIDNKILNVSDNAIYFVIRTEGVNSSDEIPGKEVLNHSVSSNPFISGNDDPFHRVSIGLGGGFGFLTASSESAEENLTSMGLSSNQAKSYYRDMKSGINGIADISFLINPRYSAGIRYRYFGTSASVEGFMDPQDGVHLFYTTYKEKIYVNYYGASFSFHHTLGKMDKWRMYADYSVGLTTYRNEAQYLNGYYLLTGKNAGLDTGIGLEYFILPGISIASDLSVFYSSIRKIKMTDGTSSTVVVLEKDNHENLSRIDLSLGIKIYMWNK